MARKRATKTKAGSSSTRKFWVMAGLGGSLTGTALFLEVLRPTVPLAAQTSLDDFQSVRPSEARPEVVARAVEVSHPAKLAGGNTSASSAPRRPNATPAR